MGYEPKNYKTDGGDKMVIGGELEVTPGGELKIGGEDVNASAVTAMALVGAMVGGYGSADFEDTTGEVEVLAGATGARNVLIIVKGIVTLAGDSNLPTFEIGDGTVDDAFAKIGHGGDPATFAKDAIAVFAGALTTTRPVEIKVTANDATAGEIQVFVIALPGAA